MNAHSHRHFSNGIKNFPTGFHASLIETYSGRQVIYGGQVWGGMQWATPVTSADAADDQDSEQGIVVTWGNPPPAPTSLTPASGLLVATFDIMSQAEGIGPMFNNTSNAVGARQDTPIPARAGTCIVTPDGDDVAMYFFWFFSLTFGVGTYRGMSAWTEAVWSVVPW